ncbi:histidine kinase [Ignatzschineria rhizosphaerae]|uniref:Sensor protein n=1 Tax=Ignatzschineria rhizosphaerae TaxID=2923279 RepID=A0ABY3X2M2_9GAMM|nr:histidine kinase [Ignatzschineria rhizosphaerae]UNM97137.1 histidine kinase [Ignatzschineria rhizosphaerae]
MKWFKNRWHNLLQRPHRLSSLLISLIIVWLLGALILIGLSLNVSWRLEERGIAINEVGSLRKQTFYLLSLAQTNDIQKQQQEYQNFIKIVDKISLFSEHNFNTRRQYQDFINQLEIIKQKSREILPHLNPEISSDEPISLNMIEAFVSEISALVSIIERDNTQSIIFLRWFQAILLIMAISSAFLSSKLLRKLVIDPLTHVSHSIQKIRQGNFKTRVKVDVNNELGEIALGFNQMTQDLEHMYHDLEKMVDIKTQELQKRHQDLTFLYKISSLLQNHKDIDFIASQFLELTIDFTNAKAGMIRILHPNKESSEVIASSGFQPDILLAPQCNHLHDCFCGQALLQKNAVYQQSLVTDNDLDILCQKYSLEHLVSFKLSMSDEALGSLNLFFNHEQDFNIGDSDLLESAARQFGLVLDNLRFEQLERQMAVLEERNFMAQGLHDSIAQSLSFLNIQSQLLTKAIENDQIDVRDQAITFIKEGIQESYDDVRELLLNFRVSMITGNFSDSILNVIERFKRQSEITVNYHFKDQGRELSPDIQLQVIFILQEALSNIRKHSKASLVKIQIEQLQERFTLLIQDNGVGFDDALLAQKKRDGHIGTLIMEERANRAAGDLRIESAIDKGTTILLTIHRTDITQKEINDAASH